MFGISFSELLLVGLVALLVLGPERLPGAARTAGLWVGRLKRSFNAIKQEVEREIGADEIRRQLHNEHILSLEEEARKIMQPQQPPAPPAAHPAVQPVANTPVTGEPGTPVMGAAPSTDSVADIGPAAPAESASVTPPPAQPDHAHSVGTPAPAPVITPATAVQSAPSANDSTQPPRAP
nr:MULTISPECIES: Sec-independent protein translocase protein TatB [unclassified Pseudomonas]